MPANSCSGREIILSLKSAFSFPENAALEVSGVGVGTLADVAFHVPPGGILGLSGPSGSGKSRLLRALADLDPHVGRITLGDIEQQAVSGHVWRAAVMMVPAESQWWADSVGEHFPVDDPDGFAALGFGPEAMTWQVSRLSSGEKQRLALLRAVVHQPRALLLDEPTANLDPDTIVRVEAWLTALVCARRWPVLWVAHDMEQIARVADQHLRIVGSALEAAI